MKVQISDKEQGRIKEATQYYEQQGLEVEVCNLEIGDYIFDNQVVFEFKTVSDFVSSIQDSRVFNECINQAENFDYHFCIIQGDEHSRAKALKMSKHYQPVTYFGYIGAISSLNRYTTVMESYSPFINEAFYRMLAQARKCLSTKPIVKKFPRKDKNATLNFLQYCIYGVSYRKANAIIQHHNIECLTDLMKLSKEDLTKVDGIGDKIADNILTAIGEL